MMIRIKIILFIINQWDISNIDNNYKESILKVLSVEYLGVAPNLFAYVTGDK